MITFHMAGQAYSLVRNQRACDRRKSNEQCFSCLTLGWHSASDVTSTGKFLSITRRRSNRAKNGFLRSAMTVNNFREGFKAKFPHMHFNRFLMAKNLGNNKKFAQIGQCIREISRKPVLGPPRGFGGSKSCPSTPK